MLKIYFKYIHEDLVIDQQVINQLKYNHIRKSIKRNEDMNISNNFDINDSELHEIKQKVEGQLSMRKTGIRKLFKKLDY